MRMWWCITLSTVTLSIAALCASCRVEVETPSSSGSANEAISPHAAPPAEGASTEEQVRTPEEGSARREEGAETGEEGSARREEGSATRQEGSGAKDAEPAGATEAEPKPKRVKADVGVGKKGRSLDEYNGGIQGMIAGPAKAYFGFREKAVFQIQIPQAMQLFKGTHGRAPKSHEEFMSQIIEANNIQLPDLPRGQRYVYDPKQEELMVERPR